MDGDRAGEASDFVQAGRVLRVASPLGDDVVLPERAVIHEGVNQLFDIALSVRAKRGDIKPGELIGRRIDVRLEIVQGGDEEGGGFGGGGGVESAIRRPFNALVTALEEGPPVTRGLRSYRMTLKPEMWLLSRRSDCRIFMDKTSLDVCEMLFAEHGLAAPDLSGVIETPPVEHYSVQWNETDLAYLLRRFENDGLFYWFSHEEGRHTLVVADHPSGWLKPSAAAEGEPRMRIAQGSSDVNHIDDWRRLYSYVSGKRSGRDWNFETPQTVPGAETPSLVDLPDNTIRELYEYPARAMDIAAHERMEKLRMQASEADHDRVEAASNIRVVEPGRRFEPYEVAHPERDYEEHVVLRATHWIVDRSYETAGDEPEYRNTFEAMPSRIPATPHRETRRPHVAGAQVGIIAGPEGEEIHCDQYGRVKLWFPWDRRAKKDGSDTCWVRVSQNWAGGSWGGQIIPRIGMEAMVAFIDGNPDRPLVTSLVPNPQQKVPYTLPANKTRSIFKTKTHKGVGYNELRFEDESGREEVFMHAQKDMNVEVRNDRTRRTGNNQAEVVGNDKAIQVGGDHDEVIAGNMSIAVGQNPLSTLISEKTKTLFDFAGSIMKTFKIPDPFNFAKGNFQFFVEKNKSEIVNGASSEIVGVVKSTVVGHTFQQTVGKAMSLIVRKRYDVDIGKIHNIRVGDQFTIKVGENSMLSMSKEGDIVISGKRIKLIADRIDQND
ncbi:type VI secretion system tip protein TssI/VgrG [Fulvimarina sp. MAC8]|uniref:type VI secretion system Vgr family protein n=1 Tax=Fulvimarina sp. MAC8 TaxID=3162874 RepID=UPI0032EBB35F